MNTLSRDTINQEKKQSTLDKIEDVGGLLASVYKLSAELDKQWSQETENPLAAYRRGEIKTLDLNQVLAKYR